MRLPSKCFHPLESGWQAPRPFGCTWLRIAAEVASANCVHWCRSIDLLWHQTLLVTIPFLLAWIVWAAQRQSEQINFDRCVKISVQRLDMHLLSSQIGRFPEKGKRPQSCNRKRVISTNKFYSTKSKPFLLYKIYIIIYSQHKKTNWLGVNPSDNSKHLRPIPACSISWCSLQSPSSLKPSDWGGD